MVELDSKWIEKLLIDNGYDITKISSLQSELAVADGENYISKIHRISLKALCKDGKIKQISVILKEKIAMDLNNKGLEKRIDDVFIKEYGIYVNVLEKIRKYLPGNDKLWADALGIDKHGNIYFEDLKETGFKVGNRLTGLDHDHCRVFIENLANFHAASYLAVENGDIDVMPYSKYVMLGTVTDEVKWKSNEIDIMVDVIKKDWGPEWSTLAERLEKFKEMVSTELLEIGKFDENRINVFCHGDSWVNNFMYKYNSSGIPEALKFVDFQVSHYNSFAFDLSYFLSTSVHYTTKGNYLNDLINLYCNVFNERLDQFGSKRQRQSSETVYKELERLTIWELSASLRIRPVIMTPPENAIKFTELVLSEGIDSKKRKIFAYPKYIEIMKVDLPKILDKLENIYKINK